MLMMTEPLQTTKPIHTYKILQRKANRASIIRANSRAVTLEVNLYINQSTYLIFNRLANIAKQAKSQNTLKVSSSKPGSYTNQTGQSKVSELISKDLQDSVEKIFESIYNASFRNRPEDEKS